MEQFLSDSQFSYQEKHFGNTNLTTLRVDVNTDDEVKNLTSFLNKPLGKDGNILLADILHNNYYSTWTVDNCNEFLTDLVEYGYLNRDALELAISEDTNN